MTSRAANPATAGIGPRASVAIMLLGVVAPLLLGVDALWPFFASNQTTWSYTIDQRVHATAAAMPGPKVLFVGGSNVVFGIKPRSLSARIGVPVVAYGVNAGIGLDLIVERAAPMIGPGDLVVMAPEVQHFNPRGALDYALRGDWLQIFGNSAGDVWGRFPWRQWIAARERCRRLVVTPENWWANRIIRAQGRWRGQHPSFRPVTPCDLRSIDAQGYNIFPRRQPQWDITWGMLLLPAEYEWETSTGAVAVRNLAEACRAKGARFLIMPPIHTTSIRGGEPAMNLALAIDRERDILRFAESYGAETLLPAGTATLPGVNAYDSSYHLNDAGVAIMEERLAEALCAKLAR